MNKLFLLDGVAGTGKSDLLEYVSSRRTDVNVIKKYTTRTPRGDFEQNKTDLNFVGEKEFEEYSNKNSFRTYNYGGKKYGFWEEELAHSITKYENTFLIVRNRGLINELRLENEMKVLVVCVFLYSDRGLIEQRLRNDGFDDDAIIFRLQRTEEIWNDYVEFDDFSYAIILNNSDISVLHQKINQLISHYKNYERQDYLYVNPVKRYRLIDSFVQYKKKMQKMLEKHPFEKNIFLMMKYRPNNFSFSQYIQRELEEKGYNCVIARDPKWQITNDSYNPIAVLFCCKYGIALFDEPEIIKDKKGKIIETIHYNPNVAYELGIMHSQRKNCLILINSELKKVPFDLLQYLHKVYTKEEEFHIHFNDWLETIKNE